jgi:hypothetical protein
MRGLDCRDLGDEPLQGHRRRGTPLRSREHCAEVAPVFGPRCIRTGLARFPAGLFAPTDEVIGDVGKG